MVLEDFYMISQVVAALAVIGSLMFVGLQMRQSNKMQQSIMHQARTDRAIAASKLMVDGSVPELMAKVQAGTMDFTPAEQTTLTFLMYTNVVGMEETDWQHKAGLLSGKVLDTQRRRISNLISLPAFRVSWYANRGLFEPGFRASVDALAVATPVSKRNIGSELWEEASKRVKQEIDTLASS